MIEAATRAWRLAGLCLLLAAAGCASLEPLERQRASADPGTRACVEWYAAVDAAVDAAGVRDAQAVRIRGFPYLRTDRFTASLRSVATDEARAFEALVDRLTALDFSARGHEIANLPAEPLQQLSAGPGGPDAAAAVVRRTRECGRVLRSADMANPDMRSALLGRLVVPDDYATGYRIAGLYALTKIPFSAGVRRQIEEVKAAYRRDLSATAQGRVIRYSPPRGPHAEPGWVRGLIARAALGPLRVPEPEGRELETLFAAYAPSFEVETTGEYDRPGALRWRDATLPQVDAAEPVVYRQVAHTRYRGTNLLQLVYTIWFPERPAQEPGDLLAGALDGVVFRVTLGPDGRPLVYDTIHPCGCYHMFFTTPRAVPVPAPHAEPEWAFVPQTIVPPGTGERMVVRVASRTHYVERLYTDTADGTVGYKFRRYDELRSLPRVNGGTRSVFGPDGVIAGTERPEAWLFWPMGVENAGAMRQWGRHATAFVGRRHFDDADLLERRFVLELK